MIQMSSLTIHFSKPVDAGGALQDEDAARRAAGQGGDAGEAARGCDGQRVGTAGSSLKTTL